MTGTASSFRQEGDRERRVVAELEISRSGFQVDFARMSFSRVGF